MLLELKILIESLTPLFIKLAFKSNVHATCKNSRLKAIGFKISKIFYFYQIFLLFNLKWSRFLWLKKIPNVHKSDPQQSRNLMLLVLIQILTFSLSTNYLSYHHTRTTTSLKKTPYQLTNLTCPTKRTIHFSLKSNSFFFFFSYKRCYLY